MGLRGSGQNEERFEHVNDITTAVLREERLRVQHDSVGKGKTPFVIEPYTLLIYKKGIYLVANSHHHDHAIRTFALDGFRAVDWLRHDRFDYPADYHPSQLSEGAFGLFAGKRERIRTFFDEKVARFVRHVSGIPLSASAVSPAALS